MTNSNARDRHPGCEGPLPRLPRFVYRYRGLLVCPPVLLAIFWSKWECEHDLLVWAASAVTFSLGLWIRIWAQQHLRFRISRNVILTRTGPYALMRNPIYLGNTLICIGLVLASELLWLAPATLLVCMATYSLAVRHEENKLIRLYGAPYAEYMSQVPRWVPRRRHGRCPPGWITTHFLASVRAEAYNLLLFVPFVLKELIHRS